MVLGLSRTRLRPDNTRIFPLRAQPAQFASRDWLKERGEVVFTAAADVVGGFPGYADRGAMLPNASVRISESFLLAEEGEPHGFGLPISWIEDVALVAQPGKEDYALRVFYRDGTMPRLFTIVFRPQRLGSRAQRRSLKAHEALVAGGLPVRDDARPPLEPIFTLPWDQTRDFENENVIWTGQATAPIRAGAEHVPSDIWLTTKSLIWGSGQGEGINRIPLPLLMDLVSTRLRDRLGTPVVYVSIGDERTGRFELPFIFDQQHPPDRNFRERGAFLVGLRSRGVPDGTATPYWQPWRLDVFPVVSATFSSEDEELEPIADEDIVAGEQTPSVPYQTWPEFDSTLPASASPLRRLGQHREPLTESIEDAPTDDQPFAATANPSLPLELPEPPRTADDTDEIPLMVVHPHQAASDVLVAQWTTHGAEEQELPVGPVAVDIPLMHAWAEAGAEPVGIVHTEEAAVDRIEPDREVERLAVAPSPPAPIDVVVARPPSQALEQPWDAVRKYESAAVGALAEVLRAIDDRVAGKAAAPLSETPPSSFDQARALAELNELLAVGVIDAATARGRRDRLIILGDVCVRLRTVVELHAGGHLTADELEAKRASLTRSLSDVLIPRAI